MMRDGKFRLRAKYLPCIPTTDVMKRRPVSESGKFRIEDIFGKAETREKMDTILRINMDISDGRMAMPHAQSILEEALEDSDIRVRCSALYTLGEMGANGLPGLGKGLCNSCGIVRSTSAALIVKILKTTRPNSDFVLPDEVNDLARELFHAVANGNEGEQRICLLGLNEIAEKFPNSLIFALGREDICDDRIRKVLETAIFRAVPFVA